uniref:Secreted protein n=1 Tax=Macrostomum lignano TaxID=282301 RepID=A0A1I8J2B7_9PLAT
RDSCAADLVILAPNLTFGANLSFPRQFELSSADLSFPALVRAFLALCFQHSGADLAILAPIWSCLAAEHCFLIQILIVMSKLYCGQAVEDVQESSRNLLVLVPPVVLAQALLMVLIRISRLARKRALRRFGELYWCFIADQPLPRYPDSSYENEKQGLHESSVSG